MRFAVVAGGSGGGRLQKMKESAFSTSHKQHIQYGWRRLVTPHTNYAQQSYLPESEQPRLYLDGARN